jgi:hypothetical protein
MKKLLALALLAASPLAFAAINIGVGGLLGLVVNIVIIGLIFWAILWFIDYVGIPEPFNKIIRVVVALVALVIIINILLGLGGTPFLVLHN